MQAAAYVKTPIFVLNSKYDTWQEKAIIGANTTITDKSLPPAAKSFWTAYGTKMVSMLEALPPQHGYYVSNCAAHCQSGTADAWTDMTIDGTGMGQAFVAWHQLHSSSASASASAAAATATRVVEQCDVSPCGSDVCHKRMGGRLDMRRVDPILA